MTQRLLLEGSDIDQLLERVRSEHGPDARIVHAQQKLVGGVGGFFARRRYEVAVAIDDDAVPPLDHPAQPLEHRTQSLDHREQPLNAAATASARPSVSVRQPAVPAAASAPSQAPARLPQAQLQQLQQAQSQVSAQLQHAQSALAAPPAPRAPASLEDLLSLADHQDGARMAAGAPSRGLVPNRSAVRQHLAESPLDPLSVEPQDVRGPGRTVSTELDAFDHLMQDLIARAGGAPAPAPAGPVPHFPAHPRPVTSPVIPPASSDVPFEHATPPVLPASTHFLDHISAPVVHPAPSADEPLAAPTYLGRHGAPDSTVTPPLASTPAAPAPILTSAPAPSSAPMSAPMFAPAPTPMSAPSSTPMSAPAGTFGVDPAASVPGSAAESPAFPQMRSSWSGARPYARVVPKSVLALGLPSAFGGRAPAVDERTVLLDVLAEAAVAPSDDLTGITVVVGDAHHGQQVTEQLIARGGASAAVLVRAGEHSSADLAEVVQRTAEEHGAAVVLVEAGPSRAQARAAGRLAAHLGAAPVTAVVDATRDSDVVRAWLEALESSGVRVADLAAHDVDESAVPLRLLGLGAPVAWLDARPATLGTWAAACLDRLES